MMNTALPLLVLSCSALRLNESSQLPLHSVHKHTPASHTPGRSAKISGGATLEGPVVIAGDVTFWGDLTLGPGAELV